MEAWRDLQPVINELISRVEGDGIASLSPSEQVVYLVWSYPGAVNNGGHSSFFYNSYGQFAAETVAALQKLGAPAYARLLSRAIEQFPRGNVPRDIDERNTVFGALPSRAHDVMEQCDSQFYALGDELLLAKLLSFWRAAAA